MVTAKEIHLLKGSSSVNHLATLKHSDLNWGLPTATDSEKLKAIDLAKHLDLLTVKSMVTPTPKARAKDLLTDSVKATPKD